MYSPDVTLGTFGARDLTLDFVTDCQPVSGGEEVPNQGQTVQGIGAFGTSIIHPHRLQGWYQKWPALFCRLHTQTRLSTYLHMIYCNDRKTVGIQQLCLHVPGN